MRGVPVGVKGFLNALANGWREAVPALRAFSLDTSPAGAHLAFEVNLDQAQGPTATAKKAQMKPVAELRGTLMGR